MNNTQVASRHPTATPLLGIAAALTLVLLGGLGYLFVQLLLTSWNGAWSSVLATITAVTLVFSLGVTAATWWLRSRVPVGLALWLFVLGAITVLLVALPWVGAVALALAATLLGAVAVAVFPKTAETGTKPEQGTSKTVPPRSSAATRRKKTTS